jgi:hypothetical protein
MDSKQVTDFGLSRFKATSESEKMTGQAGTYHWMSRECECRLGRERVCWRVFAGLPLIGTARRHGRGSSKVHFPSVAGLC